METTESDMLRVQCSVTVRRTRDEVYRFWRDLEQLPLFMQHLESVTADGSRSHWIARGPAGTRVEWDAEIVDERPGEVLSWRSISGTGIRNEGMVRFASAPGDRGTELYVELRYDPPAGRAGAAIATLLGEEPDRQVRDDLRRFKQVMETGEVTRSEGNRTGAGEGATKQHAAQALETGMRQ